MGTSKMIGEEFSELAIALYRVRIAIWEELAKLPLVGWLFVGCVEGDTERMDQEISRLLWYREMRDLMRADITAETDPHSPPSTGADVDETEPPPGGQS